MSWAEPCPIPSSFHGFDKYEFYALPDLELQLDEGDVLCFAAVLTDPYGRATICPGFSYTLDETDETLTHADGANYDTDLSHWTF